MGLKSLASVLWLYHCLSIAFAVSREFSGSGYLKYDIISKNPVINSDEDTLKLSFRTVQPTGLFFHTQNSGNELGDYITLELVGGRLRYSVRLGSRKNEDSAKEVFLGKDLSNGKSHTIDVNHNKFDITIVLDRGTSEEETREIKSKYEKLDVDVSIYVGGASSFQNLQGVKSNSPFMGCLTNVEFTPKNQNDLMIKFLDKGVADAVNVNMDKECPSLSTFEPYTFSRQDSSFTFAVVKKDAMTGSFKFRTYKKVGEVLKQTNGDNGFLISYRERYMALKVTIGGKDTVVSLSYTENEPKVNSGNWHVVKFSIGASSFSLTVDTKAPVTKAPAVAFPSDFFSAEAVAGGFTGCMRDLTINAQDKKPVKGVSNIKNVETESCNITDLCIFSPCLHKGGCSQDGKSFKCDCTGVGYKGPVCQQPEFLSNCEQLKKKLVKGGNRNPADRNYTLDIDGPGPIKASSKIYCNMTADPAITGVYSQHQGIKIITNNNGGTPAQPYVADISYFPTPEIAKALAMNSGNCKQYIEFGCKNAKLLNAGGGDKTGYWVSADGVYQKYWGGAPPNSESCACGVDKTCDPDKSLKCNCDARQNIWTKDAGLLTATADLPVTQVVFHDVNPLKSSEANFTVGNLYCSGNISNTATFVNEDGMIRLSKWPEPSAGVISLFFKTPYPRGTILYNGNLMKDYFWLEIVNDTSISLKYNIGNGQQRIELSLPDNKKMTVGSHKVVIYRNMMEWVLELDTVKGVNKNPLFLKKDLDLENDLYVGGYPYEVEKGLVGCIRGLTINGVVINLNKKAANAEYVRGGCGAACEKHDCKLGGKCVDNYNVYKCDCSLTPFYGFFCSLDKGASFSEPKSQLTYTFPTAATVPGVDIVVGFKAKSEDSCGGDIIRITSKTDNDFFLLSLNPSNKKLKFSYRGFGGDGSFEIDPPVSSFCDGNRHTFALSRRNDQVNYTVDRISKLPFKQNRLGTPFKSMEKLMIGKEGSTGFKGCITGVKVTRVDFGKTYPTVEPIKTCLYDGVTEGCSASGLGSDSKTKCGEEPEVPEEAPTARVVGTRAPGSTGPPADPTAGQRKEDNKTAIIVIVVLILVLLLVVLVIVIYWYWARHKGEYHTHEDDDELKSADPYIDMTTPKKTLGEETEKKKEWYI